MIADRTRMQWLLIAALVMFLAGNTACHLFQSKEIAPTPQNYVSDQWVTVVGNYGMASISPPQEDLRVGDLFVYPEEPDNSSRATGERGQTLASALRWGSLPVLAELNEEYMARPAWPETANSLVQTSRAPFPREWPEAKTSGEESIFASGAVPQRLPAVHLASYVNATFTGDNINVLIPTEAVNLVLGTAWLDGKVAMVTPHGAELYELSVGKVIDLMFDKVEVDVEEVEDDLDTMPGLVFQEGDQADPGTGGDEQEPGDDVQAQADGAKEPAGKETRYILKEEYREHLAFLSRPGSDTLWVQVLTEVLYIRGLDIAIQTKTFFDAEEDLMASKLEVADPEPDIVVIEPEAEEDEVESTPHPEPDTTPEPVYVTVENNPEAEDGEEDEEGKEAVKQDEEEVFLDPVVGAFARAREINELLADSEASDTPGETFRFITVTDDSVSMRRTWSRGMAIGVRGLIFEVDKHTGEVIQVGILK